MSLLWTDPNDNCVSSWSWTHRQLPQEVGGVTLAADAASDRANDDSRSHRRPNLWLNANDEGV